MLIRFAAELKATLLGRMICQDMSPEDMVSFMSGVQRAGMALRKVTGAHEMHSNSGAHLHIHLFPRYLDDDFPSAPNFRSPEISTRWWV